MKTRLTLLASLALLTPIFPEVKPVVHIFLIGGQSNAVGVDTADKLSSQFQKPHENIPFFYKVWPGRNQPDTEKVYTILQPGAGGASTKNSFGPELSFGPLVSRYHESIRSGDKVAIIKFARGGTNLHSQWRANGTDSSGKDGSVYRMFQDVVRAGLAALNDDPSLGGYEQRLQAMLWVQGEADLSHDHSIDYADNLTTFIRDVRKTFHSELEFYFTRISDNQTLYPESEDEKKVANYHLIRLKQAEVAQKIDGAFMVDIDAPRFSMLKQGSYYPLFLHFDAKGTLAIGEAFAEAYISERAPTDAGISDKSEE